MEKNFERWKKVFVKSGKYLNFQDEIQFAKPEKIKIFVPKEIPKFFYTRLENIVQDKKNKKIGPGED